MKKFTYETPEFKLELVNEDIITFSFEENESFMGEEVNPEEQ